MPVDMNNQTSNGEAQEEQMSEPEEEELSTLLDALTVCYSEKVGQTDHATLALATNIVDTLATLYDSLTQHCARQVLTGERLNALLALLTLPVADDTPRYCSLNDFQRSICRQFCAKYQLPYRPPGRLTLAQIFDAIRDDAQRQTTAEALTTLSSVNTLVTDASNQTSHAVLENVTCENLVRVVCRQQHEIEQLRQLATDMCTEVKRVDMKCVTLMVERQVQQRQEQQQQSTVVQQPPQPDSAPSDSPVPAEPMQPAAVPLPLPVDVLRPQPVLPVDDEDNKPLWNNSPIYANATPEKQQEALAAMRRLRHSLHGMKPFVDTMQQQIKAGKNGKPHDQQRSAATSDSGWMSDDDEEDVMTSEMCNSLSEDFDSENTSDLPELPRDPPQPSSSSSGGNSSSNGNGNGNGHSASRLSRKRSSELEKIHEEDELEVNADQALEERAAKKTERALHDAKGVHPVRVKRSESELIKKRLNSLAKKLKDAERKMGYLMEMDEMEKSLVD